MLNFLLRMTTLLLTLLLFLVLSLALIKFAEGSPFLSRHHSIGLAYLGTFLSVISMAYSLRKNRLVVRGNLQWWLWGHILLGSLGLLLLLVHSRYKFEALVPSLNLSFMILVGLTGLFGWHLYLTTVKSFLEEIQDLEETDEFIMSRMASSAFRFWRFVHILAAFGAIFFTIVHGISLVIFRGEF